MRIIAGERRGHKFDGPKGPSTRPTSDLAREAIFNILRDEVADRPVLDLFAGTGALGLEALSRGATHALFVERDRENAALIRRNLATLKFEGRGHVVAADAFRWARTFDPIDEGPAVAFVDPPWRDYEDRPNRIRGLVSDLMERLPSGSILVVEWGRPFDEEVIPEPGAWDLRRYGGTHLAVRTIGDEEGNEDDDEAGGEATHDG